MNVNQPDLEGYFKVHSVLDGIASLFRKYPSVFVYEIENEERYSLCLDPWSHIPTVDLDSMKAGEDVAIKVVQSGNSPKGNGIGLDISINKISFQIPDLKFHRQIELERSNAHIFRQNMRWLVILGTATESRAKVSAEVDKAFEMMRTRKAS